MSTSIMKEHILNYKNDNPKIGYFELSKHFNISLDNLFNLLSITNYKIGKIGKYNAQINIFNDYGDMIHAEHIGGFWQKWEHTNRKTYWENSYGSWSKQYFDVNDEHIYYIDSNGISR